MLTQKRPILFFVLARPTLKHAKAVAERDPKISAFYLLILHSKSLIAFIIYIGYTKDVKYILQI